MDRDKIKSNLINALKKVEECSDEYISVIPITSNLVYLEGYFDYGSLIMITSVMSDAQKQEFWLNCKPSV